jgi:hypothetical protein
MMNKEDRLYQLSQGTYTAVWAHDEIRMQSKRIAELEGSLIDIYMNELGLSYDYAVDVAKYWVKRYEELTEQGE